MDVADSLVSTDWLAERLDSSKIRVCDVRWYLPGSGRSGAAEYESAHLPGAVFVDLDRELAAPDDGRAGRHPLPDPLHFRRAMRAHGISDDTHVVAYDDTGGAVAARLWWLLRASGHGRVSLLDGGIVAWKTEGRALSRSRPELEEGSFSRLLDDSRTVDLAAVQRHVRGGGKLLDARAPERYRGETEPVDPRPGHIPGALNVPVGSTLTPERRLLDGAALREKLRKIVGDSRDVVASCGSGVTACHTLFALERSGLVPFEQGRLYVGSYSEWSRRGALPVTCGDAPGDMP
jgi:thiosulfate/3-mercaptopyruvate sulfurtransferase